MELTSQYMILDSEKNSDYSLIKILDSVSENVYIIYYLQSEKIYYYHEPDNSTLSIESLNKRFDNLQKLLDFIQEVKVLSKKKKRKGRSNRNLFNLGRKKISVKLILNRKELELQSKTETKTEISSEIPKEFLLTHSQIFETIYLEIDKINKDHSNPNYYQPIDNSIYNMVMNINNSKIGKFKFNVKLDPYAYPLVPPKITIIEPLLERNVMIQINNLDDLTIDKWNPTVSLEYLLKKFAENVINLKDYIIIDENKNSLFEELNSSLASLSGISTPKLVSFNLDFYKISMKVKKKSKYWDAGTGYGHAGTSVWDIKNFYKNRIDTEKNKVEVINKLISLLDENKKVFLDNYTNSIVEIYIKNFLNSINILEFNNNKNLYNSSFNLISELAKEKLIIIPMKVKSSLDSFLQNIMKIIETEEGDLEDMFKVLPNIQLTIDNVIVRDIMKQVTTDKKKIYEDMVRSCQFGEVKIPDDYHYRKSEMSLTKKAMIRIMSENQSLRESLPVNWDTSIVMRINEDCMNFCSFIVVGPEGTPYYNGLFEFHMYYPKDYPNVNPKVNLMTTGGGTVRFNPNLYNSGKVCLSLLGTWRGEEGESWNPKISTVLQLLISIQSLILIKDPYFNEPGWERDRGTAEGDNKSKKYNELRELETIRWAINDKIINPVVGYEEFTKNHFIMKKQELLDVTNIWCQTCKQSKIRKDMHKEREKMIQLLDGLEDSDESVSIGEEVLNKNFDYCEKKDSNEVMTDSDNSTPESWEDDIKVSFKND